MSAHAPLWRRRVAFRGAFVTPPQADMEALAQLAGGELAPESEVLRSGSGGGGGAGGGGRGADYVFCATKEDVDSARLLRGGARSGSGGAGGARVYVLHFRKLLDIVCRWGQRGDGSSQQPANAFPTRGREAG